MQTHTLKHAFRLLCLFAGAAALWLIAPSAPSHGAAAKKADPRAGEVRDVLLMLDEGPVHLRFYVALDGQALPSVREKYIDRLIATLDADRSGQISRKEFRGSPLISNMRREAANEFLASLDENRMVERDEIKLSVERVGGETVAYRQDESAADNDLEVFKFLDADGNGVIDRTEMTAAEGKIGERDSDRDECISFVEFLPEPPPLETDPLVAMQLAMTADPERPKPVVADLLRDTSEPLLPTRLVRRYDRNRDGKVSSKELNWDVARIKTIDKNGDGLLDPFELREVRKSPVDLEIAVELGTAEAGDPVLKVLSVAGDRTDAVDRPDFAKIKFPRATVSFSVRQIDPLAAATDNAMREFNRLDLDTNGYLDETETAERTRFVRGLFADIDADSDGKIFGEEMEQYIKLRAEPAATSCQVNIYDTGYGFFQSLDLNGDGRLSMRETRSSFNSLVSMIDGRRDVLAPSDPERHFHIEFVRGSYQLFGRSERMTSQSPSFVELAPVGPIWFQRMDRNSDGDLTWNEFLGPKDVFYRLDADKDGLVDPNEAEAAAQE